MNYKDFIYLDIETAGQYPDLESFKSIDIRGYDLFMRKLDRKSSQFQDWKEDSNIVYLNKVSLMPEFGRVVCVSLATIDKNNELKMKSMCDIDEEVIIKKSHQVLKTASDKTLLGLSGFYIKYFDIPWLNRKFLKYDLEIPKLLKTHNVKPWETNIADLSEIWKNFGTLESVSFDEMLYSLNIRSPKSIMEGKDVHNQFWNNRDLVKIQEYCEADVYGCVEAAKRIIHLL